MQVRDGAERCSPDDSIVHDYVDYIRQGATGGTHTVGTQVPADHVAPVTVFEGGVDIANLPVLRSF